jgi:N4-gp56 family major capsid protein
MGITTTSLLTAPVQQSFSMKLLSVPVPHMIHKIPADLKSMPRNGGTTLRMRRYNPLATAPVPLGNTGVTPAPQTLSAINVDAQISFYGTYVLLNEQVSLQNQDPVLNEATARLGVSLNG